MGVLFKKIDKDNNGSLDKKEINAAMKSKKIVMST